MSEWFNIRTWRGKTMAVGGALAGVYGLYLLVRKPKRAQHSLDLSKTKAVLEALAKAMEEVVPAVAKKEKLLRQQARRAGHSIPDEQMYQLCQQEFMREMQASEQAIYRTFKTSEGAVKRAWKRYRKDTGIAALEERILAAGGVFEKKEAEVPDFFTEDKVIDLLRDMMETTNTIMEQCVGDLAKRGITPQSEHFGPNIQRLFSVRVQKANQELPAKHGVTQEIVEAAILKYQESPNVQQVMANLEKEQRRKFQQLGIE